MTPCANAVIHALIIMRRAQQRGNGARKRMSECTRSMLSTWVRYGPARGVVPSARVYHQAGSSGSSQNTAVGITRRPTARHQQGKVMSCPRAAGCRSRRRAFFRHPLARRHQDSNIHMPVLNAASICPSINCLRAVYISGLHPYVQGPFPEPKNDPTCVFPVGATVAK